MSTIESVGSVARVWCPSCDRLETVAKPTGRSSMPALGTSYRAGWIFCAGRMSEPARCGWACVGFAVAEKVDVEPLRDVGRSGYDLPVLCVAKYSKPCPSW